MLPRVLKSGAGRLGSQANLHFPPDLCKCVVVLGTETPVVDEAAGHRLQFTFICSTQVEHIHLPVKFIGLVEMLAEHAHETWAETKMHAGWSYGKVRNDSMKKHPMLVPYK